MAQDGEGATENHDICEELLEELERRGLKLSKQVIWVTDGGGGIIKALKGRYGKKLIHQRCTLHKDRNIQRLCLLFIHPRLLASFTVALCSAINRSGVDCTF